MSAALGPFAVLLVMWCPMSISLCPSAVCCYCMFSFYVCSTWSICCLTGNAMPHVCFTLSISCLLLCCHSMYVALDPFAVLLVMMLHVCFTLSISCLLLCCCPVSVTLGPFLPVTSYPISVSVCASAVCCYCMLLSHVCGTWSIGCLSCNVRRHVHFTLSISCLLLLYDVVPCLWHLGHCLSLL